MGYHLMTSKPGTPRIYTGSLRNLSMGCYGFQQKPKTRPITLNTNDCARPRLRLAVPRALVEELWAEFFPKQ